MIEAKIVNLAITDKGFALILKPKGYEKVIPIFIGALEAQSISMVLLGLEQPRPLSHDLFTNVLEKFTIKLHKIVVDDLRHDTFYAKMVLEQDGKTLRMDSRPSDAIAMALRMKAPLFVEEKVIEEAGIFLEEQEGKISLKDSLPINFKNTQDAKEKPLETMMGGEDATDEREPQSDESPKNKVEQLSLMLQEALREERYEDAAALRDELNRLSPRNDE